MASRLSQKRPALASPTTPIAESSVPCQPPQVQLPPALCTSSPLLASAISLSPNSVISYVRFVPSSHDGVQAMEDLELARRDIVRMNQGLSVQQALLPLVKLAKEDTSLWIFAVEETSVNIDSRLALLQFNNLSGYPVHRFAYQELYPCSVACSRQRTPCPLCLNPSAFQSPHALSGTGTTTATSNFAHTSPSDLLNGEPSAARFQPRIPLRKPYALFLDATRDLVIDRCCSCSGTLGGRSARRLHRGFLLGPAKGQSEWSSAWEHVNQQRQLTYCSLSLSLHRSHILIQPHLQPSSFYPLQSFLPLPEGTPIHLLPYSVPAYYLNTYSGPSASLTKQFELQLEGVGAGDWSSALRDNPSSLLSGRPSGLSENALFVIAWIGVQNKQGEDKGIVVIWPTALCLAIASATTKLADGTKTTTYAYNRHKLSHIPDLPVPLQPSPVPAHATVVPPAQIQTSPAAVAQTPVTLSAPTPNSNVEDVLTTAAGPSSKLTRPSLLRARTITSSDTLTAFRSLALAHSTSRDLRRIASNVGNYVEDVAKERERERERMRRERDAATAGHSPKPSSSQNNSMHTIAASYTSTEPHEDQPKAMNSPSTEIRPQMRVEIPLHQTITPEMKTSALSGHDSNMENTNVTSALHSAAPASAGQSAHEQMEDPVANLSTYGAVNGGWSQGDSFMLDFDMGFDVNIAVPPLPEGAGRGQPDIMAPEIEGFGVFTDDDFSFFDDGPPRNDMAVLPSQDISHIRSDTGLTPAAGPAPLGMSPPIFDHNVHMSGSGLSAVSLGQAPPWAPSVLGEGFDPKFAPSSPLVTILHTNQAPVPPSPIKTPMTRSDAETPDVQIVPDIEILGSIRRSSLVGHDSVFDAIPFSETHRQADSKYVKGKFALPTPPDSEDRTECFVLEPGTGDVWKAEYDTATDPRVGIVKRLRGVKRRASMQGLRDVKSSPTWTREHEEWVSPGATDDTTDAPYPPSEQDTDSDEDFWVDEEEEIMISRPSTPIPSYLPLGPSLLTTQFLHAKLLPLSTNLRSSAHTFSSEDLNLTAPVCAPTPVSPAAILGTASERGKPLEAAGQIIGQEIVESYMWAEAWRTSGHGKSTNSKNGHVWPMDVQSVACMLKNTTVSDDLLDLRGWLDIVQQMSASSPSLSTKSAEHEDELSRLTPLETPLFSVAKADAIIQVLPTALRFWDKLGLAPRGGVKNCTVYLLHQNKDEDKTSQFSSWLKLVDTVYAAKGFGSQKLGVCAATRHPGLLPIRYESFHRTLGGIIDTLPMQADPFLFYLVISPSLCTLASPVLRTVLTGIKKALDRHGGRIYFQFVPDYVVTAPLNHPAAKFSSLGPFVDSVYNRLLRPVDRVLSQRFSATGEKIREYFESPVFTIAYHLPGTTSFSFEHPQSDLGLMDRHTMLHVGYHVTHCKKWIIAACIDERGEAHDMRVWIIQDVYHEEHVIKQVWEFAMGFARKANIEWRISIAKLGCMGETELESWMNYLTPSKLPEPVHVSILCVEPEASLIFLPLCKETEKVPSSKPSMNRSSSHERQTNGSFLLDASTSTYILPTLFRIPFTSPLDRDLGTDYPFVPDEEDAPSSTEFPLRPLHTAALIRTVCTPNVCPSVTYVHFLHSIKAPKSRLLKSDCQTHEDIVQNYHELAVLTAARWKFHAPNTGGSEFGGEGLPFHLAALQIVQEALECGEVDVE